MSLPHWRAAGKTHPQPSGNVSFVGSRRSCYLGEALEDHGHALAAADAHGLQADGLVVELEAVDEGGGDPRPRHAERVADGDRAAVDVQPGRVDAQVLVG